MPHIDPEAVLHLNLTPEELGALQAILEGALEAAAKYGGTDEDIKLFRSLHNKSQMAAMGNFPQKN
jgi:hypothetical protein